jgi:hypothetical protein
MPAAVKLLYHFKSLDELVVMGDNDQEKLKPVPLAQCSLIGLGAKHLGRTRKNRNKQKIAQGRKPNA